MDDSLRLIGGVIYLILAITGMVFGWRWVGQLRRFRRQQEALMPEVHAMLVAQRQDLLEQAYSMGRSADDVASRMEGGPRAIAESVLIKGMAMATGRPAGIWAPLLAKIVVAGIPVPGTNGRSGGRPHSVSK